MHNIVVEKLFVTSEQIQKGLMFDTRPLSSEDVVALFVLENPRFAAMWMKNTPTALDMIFIDENKMIAHIHKNAQPFNEKLIKSPIKVLFVVEALAGYVDRKKLKVGDQVQFSSYKVNSFTIA
jgi:uncharacterized membrane protein (UPF0127 family)